ncbi:MAG: hypothetical protein US22_C0004G0001, partial [candidate division TM6 bacterium GW2011_GWF2_36_6]
QEPHNYLIPVFSQSIACKDDKNIPLILMHNGLPALAAGVSLAFGSTPASLSFAGASIAAGGVSILAGPAGWAIGAAALGSYALFKVCDKNHKELLQLEMSEGGGSGGGDPNDPNEAQKKSDEAINKVLQESKPGRETKGSTKQFEKPGGIEEAIKDFNKMGIKEIKKLPNNKNEGSIGKLPDGRIVNVRTGSKDGRPSLEIYNGKSSIKIRYGFK